MLLLCLAPAFPARVVLSLGEFAILLLPNELLAAQASGLLSSPPCCCFEAKPHQVYKCTAQPWTSSLHTFRHNIYNCTWPWSIALFQINDHTIYLLGFCTFSVLRPKLQLCPNSSQESVVEPFMEALNSQHRAGLATRAVPSPSPSTDTSAQVTAREPLVCFSSHGCPILLLLMHWGPSSPAVQMCCWVTRWGHSH